MSNSASTANWDDDVFDTDNSEETVNMDDPKLSRKQRLDIRRKLEDRMEMKRLRDEIGELDEYWFD
jgi:hypothetical protein